jgi:hypothetical protein
MQPTARPVQLSSGRRIAQDTRGALQPSFIVVPRRVRCLARGDLRLSPTYIYSFGWVPTFYESPFISDDASAQAAAATLYARVKGVPYQRTLVHTPNPALEPDDPIRVFPRGMSDPLNYELHIAEQLTTPLTPGGTMTTRTREHRIT